MGVSATAGEAAGLTRLAYAGRGGRVKATAAVALWRGVRHSCRALEASPHRWKGRAGLLLAAVLAVGSPAAAGPRVYSLDQCADQYVMALAPRGDIVGLSYRADDADSYLRDQARGILANLQQEGAIH